MKKSAVRSLAALLLAAVMLFAAVPALAEPSTGNFYMYVQTGNTGRLHLRALPTANSESLGLYANGTQVLVESVSGGWAYVQVGGRRGYMSMNCLTGTTPCQPIVPPTPTEDTTLYIQTGNTGRLHLREYASQNARSLGLYANGTPVRVTSRVNGWAFVQVNGMYGYMMLKYLTNVTPGSDPSSLPPVDPSAYTLMYVRTGNTGRLHLREYASQSARSLGLYSNGTPVYAASLGNGWSKVIVNGQPGYMMSQFLSANSGGTPAPVPVDPQPVPEGAVWMFVCTGNTGKLHLRENMSAESASLGLYPNGTQVAVINNYGTWAYVNVAGRTGYMMTQFLKNSYVPSTDPAPSVPSQSAATATVRQPNGSFVYLRSTDSSASLDNVICKVPSGTVVDVIAWGKLWTRIRYNGYEGYMVTNYLK